MMIPKWLTFFGPPCVVIQRKFNTKLQYSNAFLHSEKNLASLAVFNTIY